MKGTLNTFGVKNALTSGKYTCGAQLCKLLLELLERREKLAPLADEFALIDNTLKTYFYGVKDLRLGGYRIKGVCRTVKILNLPEKLKDKYTKTNKGWTVNISKVKK